MTTYLLTCGHKADVPGPCGATSGRAWCDTCDGSRFVVGELRRCHGCGHKIDEYAPGLTLCAACEDEQKGGGSRGGEPADHKRGRPALPATP